MKWALSKSIGAPIFGNTEVANQEPSARLSIKSSAMHHSSAGCCGLPLLCSVSFAHSNATSVLYIPQEQYFRSEFFAAVPMVDVCVSAPLLKNQQGITIERELCGRVSGDVIRKMMPVRTNQLLVWLKLVNMVEFERDVDHSRAYSPISFF